MSLNRLKPMYSLGCGFAVTVALMLAIPDPVKLTPVFTADNLPVVIAENFKNDNTGQPRDTKGGGTRFKANPVLISIV